MTQEYLIQLAKYTLSCQSPRVIAEWVCYVSNRQYINVDCSCLIAQIATTLLEKPQHKL